MAACIAMGDPFRMTGVLIITARITAVLITATVIIATRISGLRAHSAAPLG